MTNDYIQDPVKSSLSFHLLQRYVLFLFKTVEIFVIIKKIKIKLKNKLCHFFWFHKLRCTADHQSVIFPLGFHLLQRYVLFLFKTVEIFVILILKNILIKKQEAMSLFCVSQVEMHCRPPNHSYLPTWFP